jgi:transaldolase
MTYFAKEEEQPKEKYLEEKVANLKDQLVIALDRIEDLQAQQKRNNRIVSNLKELLVYKEEHHYDTLAAAFRGLYGDLYNDKPEPSPQASITFPDGTVRTIYKNEEHEEVKTKKPVRKVVKPVKKGKRK